MACVEDHYAEIGAIAAINYINYSIHTIIALF